MSHLGVPRKSLSPKGFRQSVQRNGLCSRMALPIPCGGRQYEMKRIVVALAATVAISCSDADQVSQPTQAALLTSNLTFVRFSDDAFAAAEKNGSFWAVPGESRA